MTRRWHKVWQELDGHLLEDLLIQLSILRDEVAFILNNTEINNNNKNDNNNTNINNNNNTNININNNR